MAKPRIAIVIRDGVVHSLVSNDDIECLVLDYDDVRDEEVPNVLSAILSDAASPSLLTPGDPDQELESFKEAVGFRQAELDELYGR